MFAKESLALKVLGDRVRETVADLLDAMPRNVFDERFTPVPIISRCDGAAKIVSLLTQRPTSWAPTMPARHPPQLLHTLTRTLRLRLTRSALRPRSMQNTFQWTGTMSRKSVAVLQRSWILFSVWVGTRRIEMHLFLRKLTRCRCISGSFWRRRSVVPAGPAGKSSAQISYASERLDGWTDGRTDGRTDGWMDGWMKTWLDAWMDGRMGGRVGIRAWFFWFYGGLKKLLFSEMGVRKFYFSLKNGYFFFLKKKNIWNGNGGSDLFIYLFYFFFGIYFFCLKVYFLIEFNILIYFLNYFINNIIVLLILYNMENIDRLFFFKEKKRYDTNLRV